MKSLFSRRHAAKGEEFMGTLFGNQHRMRAAAAKHDLVMKGVFNRLRPDWERIQTVAPLIAQTIHEIHQSSVVAKRPWHAEAIYKILHDRNFRDLRMEDSHLGNCATIWAIKPD